jgi:hypothetical protein
MPVPSAMRLPLLILPAVLLAGCGSIDKRLTEGGIPRGGSVVPNVPIRLTPQYSTTLVAVIDKLVAGAVLNYVYQPLDANWDLADIPLSADTHRFSLRMKRFSIGGDGEAWQLARRYAERLQVEKGASGFVFLEFTSGIDSATPFARRVAEGKIRFNDVPADPGPLPAATPDPAG